MQTNAWGQKQVSGHLGAEEETDNKPVWGKFWGEGNIYNLNCDDGFKGIYLCQNLSDWSPGYVAQLVRALSWYA